MSDGRIFNYSGPVWVVCGRGRPIRHTFPLKSFNFAVKGITKALSILAHNPSVMFGIDVNNAQPYMLDSFVFAVVCQN